MGKVDLNFKPAVPVFDANAELGRRHDRRNLKDSPEQLFEEMARAGVDRALVWHPNGAAYDSMEGNLILQELIHGDSRLVPQFFCNPSFDDFDVFTRSVKDAAVRSIRMVPQYQHYPFREWVVGPWLDWMEREGLALWLPATYTVFGNTTELNSSDVYDTIREHPHLNVVLSEIHYSNVSWAVPLLKSLPNVYVETSKLTIADPINRFLEFMDDSRILFGSRYPNSAMGVHIYALHHMGLPESTVRAICAGNLERLLGMG